MADLMRELLAFRRGLFEGPRAAIVRRLHWLQGRIGKHASIVFDATVGRVEPVDADSYQPVDTPDGGMPAVILPVHDGDGAVVDLVATLVDPKGAVIEVRRRRGLAGLMGQDAIDRAETGMPLRLYPDPLAWMRGWEAAHGAVMEKLAAVRHQAEAAADWPAVGRVPWAAQLQADRIERRAIMSLQNRARLPSSLPRPGCGSPGICILDWGQRLEADLSGIGPVICDDVATAERLSAALKEARRTRRAREPRLPQILVPQGRAA